jgi:NDP-4-keto-2,6-dideoxyhexose 3-C-methyltransferase
MTSYDTICHEHLEYYGMRQIAWLCARAGLKVVDIELNDVNGGSFSVTAAKAGAPLPEASNLVASLIAAETEAGLAGVEPYRAFNQRVLASKDKLRGFVAQARRDGKLLLGCGASTKGNVILQLCGFTADDIPCIADVNEDKHGCFTPGTLIPIVSEADARARQPSYFLVLPWHFRTSIVAREAEFLRGGGQLVFPLPDLELVGNADP